MRGFLVIVALLIGGCAAAERQKAFDDAKLSYDRDVANCERQHPGPHKRPIVPRVQCFNEARLRFLANDASYADLDRALSARLLVAAEKYDAGRLTIAEYEAEKTGLIANYNSDIQRRRDSAAMVNAARAASMPVVCNKFGNTVTCY
jgi:hypothetical protein